MNCEAAIIPPHQIILKPYRLLPFVRRRLYKRPRIVGDTSGNLKLKNINNAVGSTNQPSTTSTTYAVVPEMTVTITSKGNKVAIIFTCSVQINQSTSLQGYFALFKDGAALTPDFIVQSAQASGSIATVTMCEITYIDSPTAASHTYDVRWKVDNTFTLVARNTARSLQVVELG